MIDSPRPRVSRASAQTKSALGRVFFACLAAGILVLLMHTQSAKILSRVEIVQRDAQSVRVAYHLWLGLGGEPLDNLPPEMAILKLRAASPDSFPRSDQTTINKVFEALSPQNGLLPQGVYPQSEYYQWRDKTLFYSYDRVTFL